MLSKLYIDRGSIITNPAVGQLPGTTPKSFYGYIVVAAAFFSMLLMWGTSYSFGVFFKPLLAEFGWTRTMTSGAYSLSMFLTGLFSIIAGRLTDRFGPKLVISGCAIFLGLGFLLVSRVDAIWQLYLFYGLLIGVGLSGAGAPLLATVARWFTKRRGMMTGIASSGMGMGTLIIPPVANWLISAYGWRTSYIVVGITVLVLLLLVAQFLKRDPGQVGQSLSGGSEVKEGNLNPVSRGLSLVEALRTRQLWQLCLMFFFFGITLQIIMVHIVPHATDLEISATRAAVIIAIIGGVSIAGRIILGMAGDGIGNKLALVLSLSTVSFALLWLLITRELWTLYLFAALFGFGYGGVSCLSGPVFAEQFGLTSVGILLGVNVFSCAIGETIGPVVAGYIFDVTGNYNAAFLLSTAISVISIILAVTLTPASRKSNSAV